MYDTAYLRSCLDPGVMTSAGDPGQKRKYLSRERVFRGTKGAVLQRGIAPLASTDIWRLVMLSNDPLLARWLMILSCVFLCARCPRTAARRPGDRSPTTPIACASCATGTRRTSQSREDGDRLIVTPEQFEDSVHGSFGMSCVSCHVDFRLPASRRSTRPCGAHAATGGWCSSTRRAFTDTLSARGQRTRSDVRGVPRGA